jgi:hypothetical protein
MTNLSAFSEVQSGIPSALTPRNVLIRVGVRFMLCGPSLQYLKTGCVEKGCRWGGRKTTRYVEVVVYCDVD